MKLMMPPGALLVKVDAEPPRMASMRSRVKSERRKMSELPKAISPNSITGRPSSCSCRNFAPPEATGNPRTAMLALPSPPLDSERMPGILRKISAVLRGADCSTASAPTVLTETLDLSLVVAVDVPVTNTESRLTAALSAAGGVAGAAAAVSWASAAGAHRQDTTAQARACRRMVCKVDIAILSLTDGGVPTPASSPPRERPCGLQCERSNTPQYNRLQSCGAT